MVADRMVSQRQHDLIDPRRINKETGLTNLEAMRAGKAQSGSDGQPIELHHLIQSDKGGIAEVEAKMHRKHSKTLHIKLREAPPPAGSIGHRFDAWRKKYWTLRAKGLRATK